MYVVALLAIFMFATVANRPEAGTKDREEAIGMIEVSFKHQLMSMIIFSRLLLQNGINIGSRNH